MATLQLQQTQSRVEEKSYEENPPSKQSHSSSPSHEFSFTVSLNSSSTTVSSEKAKAGPFAVDLSPADDIFFHGHLLPLHLLSHLPVSPRSSANSPDSFTLPISDLMPDKEFIKETSNSSNHSKLETNRHESNDNETRERAKFRPFSLFGLMKWRRESEAESEQEEKLNYKRKLKFDVGAVLKRYARMVRPLVFFKGRKDNMC